MREALSTILRAARFLGTGIVVVLTTVFGRWHWDRPAWLSRAAALAGRGRRALAARPKHAAAAACVLVVATAGAVWWATRPTPHYVTYVVNAPELTTYNDNGSVVIKPLTVVFSEPAAPLATIKAALTTGIEMSPPIAGTWTWANDTELLFTPKNDWPVDAAFTVRMAKRGFVAPRVVLEQYRFTFRSRPFTARVKESEFYQDPRDPNLKKVVATVAFSHPVDTARFESLVSLAVAKDAEYLGLTSNTRYFTVTYDKFKLAASVHSAALPVPRDDTPMTVVVAPGVRAARGGNETVSRLEAKVTIPGRGSLTFTDARMVVVDNARYEPEQILLVTSSSPVTERAFEGKVEVKLLPVRHPRQPREDRRPYQWNAPESIGADILGPCPSVPVAYVPSEEGGETSHGFKFVAPVGRFLHVLVRADVPGTGGYLSVNPYVATVRVRPYPQTLTFLGQGSLLPLTGDRRVGYLARGVGKIEAEIARVLPNQLQHLAPRMWDFSQPSFYDQIEDQLVERFVSSRDYSARPPGKPTYDSIDVGQYLRDQPDARRGLFVLHLRQVSRRPTTGSGDEDSEGESQPGDVEDHRLILVTDLGFIVKQAKDGSSDVFVQSLGTGLPVAGARVDLVGANGQAALSVVTDAGGRAQLPRPSNDLQRERAPRLILVQKDADYSFLPFTSYGRQLELSRFDVGGVENAQSARQLSTYLFSDRGIYRPGETVHLGAITRTADWRAGLGGLPLELDITDSRGAMVARTPLTVSAASFEEVSYATPAAAPTGTYEAVAYLARDGKRREALGSTTFKVQEFEPDRLKVQLDLSDRPIEGWLKPTDVKARLSVAHLFGEPAGQRRVEGELSLTRALPRFGRYPEHRFSVGEGLTEPYAEGLAATTTDDKGVAVLALDLQRFTGRAYRLNVLGRAFESEGGRHVAAQNSAIVSEAAFLVGVKTDGDLTFVRRTSARAAHWIAVDQQLAPVAADRLTLEWVQRKFVSVLTKQDNDTLKYVSRQKTIVRSSRGVRIAAGGSTFALPTDEPGDFELVLRDATGAKLNSLAYSVAGQADVSRSLERDAELQVQLDRPAYGAGDTIQVAIRAPYVGAGLITIERDRVYRHQWFKTTTTSSVQQITLPADFEGNGYVSVQFLRDPASDELFMSPLSYGVAPFAANLSARTQEIGLVVPRRVKPGATLTMRVDAGEASRVAVLAVDEGILQVARYKNPDPLGFFFQKRMLEVSTRQILDLVLPDFKRFVALAAPGGDADAGFAKNLNPFAKKRKPAVAFWSGVLDVGPGQRDLSYTVPDYFNGRLRVVAIAVSPRRIGITAATTEVQGDFILTPNVPATVTPGDEFSVSVGVFNNTTGAGTLRVDVQVGPGLSVVGPASVDLSIAPKREGVGEFRVKANAVLGPASLAFTARKGTASARVEESVGVRPAAAFRTHLTLGRVDGASLVVPLAREMYRERRRVEASVSPLPLVWGQGLTAYLDAYEYSCTEQLVSKGMAALVLLSRPEFGTIRKAGPDPLAATYATLRGRANNQGGIGLWASTPMTAEFPSVYALHFLVEAQERGQRIPQEMLANLDAWVMRLAMTPASSLGAARLRAYAVYLLARQGIKPTAAISNVEQELTKRYPDQWSTDLAAAYLASTYRLLQRTADAERIVKAVPWSTSPRSLGDDLYYDVVVHDAQLLYLLARHFPARLGAAPPAALETLGRAANGNQASSLSAAYTMLALDAFAKTVASGVTLGITEVGKDGRERALPIAAGAMARAAVSETAARVKFSQRGGALAYYALSESGFDVRPPSAETSQGIEIVRELVDAKGNPIARVAVGEEFSVRLRVRATSRDLQAAIAIVDVLPGGVEPVLELRPPADSSEPGVDPATERQRGRTQALPVGVAGKSDWSPTHVDVREDRLILYGDARKTAGTFVYRVRATTVGVFQVPPVFAEGMYNRAVVGLGRAASLEVVKK